MKFSKADYLGLSNKMAEIVLVCKTKNEKPLLLNGINFKNSSCIKNC